MNAPDGEKTYFLDKPKNQKLVRTVFYACCVALLAFDLVYHRHVEREFEGLFGFYAFYGLIACVVLVLTAKEMRKIVMRKEDYYDD
jgi:hypothetical protein